MNVEEILILWKIYLPRCTAQLAPFQISQFQIELCSHHFSPYHNSVHLLHCHSLFHHHISRTLGYIELTEDHS